MNKENMPEVEIFENRDPLFPILVTIKERVVYTSERHYQYMEVLGHMPEADGYSNPEVNFEFGDGASLVTDIVFSIHAKSKEDAIRRVNEVMKEKL